MEYLPALTLFLRHQERNSPRAHGGHTDGDSGLPNGSSDSEKIQQQNQHASDESCFANHKYPLFGNFTESRIGASRNNPITTDGGFQTRPYNSIYLLYHTCPNYPLRRPRTPIMTRAKGAKVTGRGPSSRANARDLRKISPGVYPELAEGVARTPQGHCVLATWRENFSSCLC